MGDEPARSPKEMRAGPLSQWLQLMLAEIARKREENESARTEAARRASEGDPEAGCRESDGTENPPLS